MAPKDVLLLLLLAAFFVLRVQSDARNLRYHYYKDLCPQVEKIIYRQTAKLMAKDPTLGAPLLRMHFHDCFVRGCDASVLLNSGKGFTAEKDSEKDATLSGYTEIDMIKAAVERECPGVVSCADILAIVARDAVYLNQGPYYEVPLGRQDGTVSLATEAQAELPSQAFNISQLINHFASKGLNVKDLVVLSGAHTIGQGHCSSFANRIYNYTPTGSIDPSLNTAYALRLRKVCAPPSSADIAVDMDFTTPTKFDVNYYKNVREHKGLFESDAALLNNPITKAYVDLHSKAIGTPSFFADFAKSMVKMGTMGVLTGKQGQIRKICYKINS